MIYFTILKKERKKLTVAGNKQFKFRAVVSEISSFVGNPV